MKDIERMVVSAHEDGEVESPWKERVIGKIADDADWAAESQLHRRVKAVLAADAEPDFAEALARVKTGLGGGVPVSRTRSLPMWLSVAAAALLILAAGGGFLLGRQAPSESVAELQVQVPKQLPLKLSGEGQLIMASTLQGISH